MSEFVYNTLITDSAKQQIYRVAILMIAINLLLPLALYVYSIAAGEQYWRLFRGEFAITEWLSSVQLLLIAWVAYVNFVLHRRKRSNKKKHREDGWIWRLIAIGFVIFTLDERFGIHEGLRDGLFRPLGLGTGIPWLVNGDIGLYLFFVIGLVISYYLWREFRGKIVPIALYVAALVLTFATIVIDSMDDDYIERLPFWRFWDYPFEEAGETWAQLLFLLSFLYILYTRITLLALKRATRQA